MQRKIEPELGDSRGYATPEALLSKFPEGCMPYNHTRIHTALKMKRKFGKKRHHKRGIQTIVIGAIETDTRRLRLQVIPDTEQDSIELFLQKWVTRDSHLITDCGAGYNGVEWLGYTREAYPHFIGHFGMSNHIECIWSAMKRHLRKLYGSCTNNLLTRHPERVDGQTQPTQPAEPLRVSAELPTCYCCSVLVDRINRAGCFCKNRKNTILCTFPWLQLSWSQI